MPFPQPEPPLQHDIAFGITRHAVPSTAFLFLVVFALQRHPPFYPLHLMWSSSPSAITRFDSHRFDGIRARKDTPTTCPWYRKGPWKGLDPGANVSIERNASLSQRHRHHPSNLCCPASKCARSHQCIVSPNEHELAVVHMAPAK